MGSGEVCERDGAGVQRVHPQPQQRQARGGQGQARGEAAQTPDLAQHPRHSHGGLQHASLANEELVEGFSDPDEGGASSAERRTLHVPEGQDHLGLHRGESRSGPVQ